MMRLLKIMWVVWILSMMVLVLSIVYDGSSNKMFLILLLVLNGGLLYSQEIQRKSMGEIAKKIKDIDLEPLEKEMSKMRSQQTDHLMRSFDVELQLNEYKKEQERKYRDIVRKVLDLDNKLNEKFDLLGKAILKVSKKGKESF